MRILNNEGTKSFDTNFANGHEFSGAFVNRPVLIIGWFGEMAPVAGPCEFCRGLTSGDCHPTA
jgi:hypothetical protein